MSTPTGKTRTSAAATKHRAATTLTPDQDVVDDIGAALGVKYDDNEELKAADKVIERDKHRMGIGPGIVGGLQRAEMKRS